MNWVDLLEKLKAAVGMPGGGQFTEERRVTYRVERRFGLVANGWNDEQHQFNVTDVGPRGLRADCKNKIAKGEKFELWAPTMLGKAQASELLIEVVWARKKKDSKLFEGGMQFILDTAKRKQTVAKFLLEDCKLGVLNPREKRKYLRVRVNEAIGGQMVVSETDKVDIKVRDLALRGALLVSPRPFQKGTMVQPRISLPKQPVLNCKGEVMWQNRSDNAYELGVYFTDVPSDHQEALKRFLVKSLEQANR